MTRRRRSTADGAARFLLAGARSGRLSASDFATIAALPQIDRRLAALGQPWDGSACLTCTEVHHPTRACRPADLVARSRGDWGASFAAALAVAVTPEPEHCHAGGASGCLAGEPDDVAFCDCTCGACAAVRAL